MLVENRFLRRATHAGGAHFVDALADGGLIVIGADALRTHRLKHFRGVVHHVLAHGIFVFLKGCVRDDEGQAPFVGFVRT